MIQRVVHNGRIICFEPHWIANMANYRLHGVEQSRIVPLGSLQKLFEHDAGQQGKDGNIGTNIPVLLSQLGINHSWFTYAPNMQISFGIITHE